MSLKSLDSLRHVALSARPALQQLCTNHLGPCALYDRGPPLQVLEPCMKGLHNPNAPRTRILRFLGSKTISFRTCYFEPWGLSPSDPLGSTAGFCQAMATAPVGLQKTSAAVSFEAANRTYIMRFPGETSSSIQTWVAKSFSM